MNNSFTSKGAPWFTWRGWQVSALLYLLLLSSLLPSSHWHSLAAGQCVPPPLLSSGKWRELYFVKPAVLLQSGPNTWWKVGFISVAQSKFVRYWQYWRILPCLSRAEKYRPNSALLYRDKEGFYISVFCVPCRIWEHLLTSVILRVQFTRGYVYAILENIIYLINIQYILWNKYNHLNVLNVLFRGYLFL